MKRNNLVAFKLLMSLIAIISCNSNEGLLDGSSHKSSIEFLELNQKLYVEARMWGISGDHEEITIALNAVFNLKDSLTIQKFYTSEIFHKKVGVDTLIIFAPSSSYHKDYKHELGKVKLLIKPLLTSEDITHYNKHHIRLGLTKVSINN